MNQENIYEQIEPKYTNSEDKTTVKKMRFDIRQGIWLTQAQKIYIQHKMPKLYSLVAVPTNSRLVINSKMLEEESIQFTRNKRGRPEGSYARQMVQSPTKSRKSMRISIRRQKLDAKQSEGSESSESEQNQQLYSLSYAKQLEFSRSASKFDLVADLNEQDLIAEKPQAKQKDKYDQEQMHKVDQCVMVSVDALQSSQRKVEKTKKESKAAKQKTKKIAEPAAIIQNKQEQIQPIKEIKVQKEEVCQLAQCEQQVKQQQVTDRLQIKQTKQSKQSIVNEIREKMEQIQSKIIYTKFAAELQILNKLKAHENILPFLEPVDQARDGAPDYYTIITDPIDIQTIEFKLNNNIYKEPEEFHQDITKMWNNARAYNIDNKFMLRVTNSLEKYYSKLAKLALPSKTSKSKGQKNKKASKKVEE